MATKKFSAATSKTAADFTDPTIVYLMGVEMSGTPAPFKATAFDVVRTGLKVAWSGTGVATTPLLVNVTADPGPANAASKLLDLQVAGSSKASFNKSGQLVCSAAFISDVVVLGPSSDVQLYRDASDILAQRRSTNGNTFKVYRTYTSSSTFERGTFGWHDSSSDTGTVGNTLRIGTEKGSVGGTARAVSIITDGTERINVGASGGITMPSQAVSGMSSLTIVNDRAQITQTGMALSSAFLLSWGSSTHFGSQDSGIVRAGVNILGITNGSTGGGALEFTEMTAPATPAADKARIFARDNGSGKTQVCIILPDGVVTVLATQT